MKKYLTMALVGAVMLGMGSVAMANTCAFDNVPAATLLFPFVAYNYTDGAQGVNTLFTVTNTSSEAQIVHITVWTDFSIAILDFNILLTGYDVQPMDIRTILANGQLPVTTVGGHTTTEGIVDDGPLSEANEFSPVDPFNPDDPRPTSDLSQPLLAEFSGLPGQIHHPDSVEHPRAVRGLAEEQPDRAAVSRQLRRFAVRSAAHPVV